jgi:hypothetical protein
MIFQKSWSFGKKIWAEAEAAEEKNTRGRILTVCRCRDEEILSEFRSRERRPQWRELWLWAPFNVDDTAGANQLEQVQIPVQLKASFLIFLILGSKKMISGMGSQSQICAMLNTITEVQNFSSRPYDKFACFARVLHLQACDYFDLLCLSNLSSHRSHPPKMTISRKISIIKDSRRTHPWLDCDFPDTLGEILGASCMATPALDLDGAFGTVDSFVDFNRTPLLSLPFPSPSLTSSSPSAAPRKTA